MTWSRREFVTLAVAAAIPRAALARNGPAARMGWLTAQQPASLAPYLEALRQGLAEHHLAEGETIEILYRYGEDDAGRVPALAKELVAAKVDLVIAQGTAASIVHKMGLEVPVVFVTSADPIAAGFAKSLSEPIGNTTGVTFMAFEFLTKRLELLREMLPKIKHVTLVGNPAHPGSEIERATSEEAGWRYAIDVDFIPTPTRDSIATAAEAIRKNRPDAISLLADGLAIAYRKDFIDLAMQESIPVISGWPVFAEAGAVCTYGPNLPQVYRRVAYFVARILDGAPTASLPVERPTQFELVLNSESARRLNLTFSRALLARADVVLE